MSQQRYQAEVMDELRQQEEEADYRDWIAAMESFAAHDEFLKLNLKEQDHANS